MSKYIDADRLKVEIERLVKINKELKPSRFTEGIAAGYGDILSAITSLQQEQSKFPITDEEVEKALASIKKAELPDKYKTPDWLFKLQEHHQVADASKMERVELENEIDRVFFQKDCGSDRLHHKEIASIANHFYELGLNARKED